MLSTSLLFAKIMDLLNMRIRGIYALLALAGLELRGGRLCPKKALGFARERG